MTLTGLTDRQLALVLAVEAHPNSAGNTPSVERLADKYLKYLETGRMG